MPEFVLGLTWADVPVEVRTRIVSLLRDFVAVSVAGRVTLTARLAADYAASQHPGDHATALFDRRRLAPTGAAWANGVLANSLDFDDGHRLVKGHPGANVIPSALAVAEAAGADLEDFLAAVAVGYEVAIRAGLHMHERRRDHHGSGAWGAVGAAAGGVRLLGLDAGRAQHALGLAEYHAPFALTMRSVADPAMTKDASGFGAFVGASSALLAERGFTAVSSSFLDEPATARDLGERWHVLDVYVKKFPCCRWSHPAIEAALWLRGASVLEPERITSIQVRTFAAAAALARRQPATTEEAQYSLVWPVAVAFARGDFGVVHVLEPSFDDPCVRELASRVRIEVDPSLEAAFPARRLAQVSVTTVDGVTHRSALVEPSGEPDDPRWLEIVEGKLERFVGQVDGLPRLLSKAARLGPDGLASRARSVVA